MSYSVIVKEDCATCQLVVPVIKQLKGDDELTIYSQDNGSVPVWCLGDRRYAARILLASSN